MKQLTEFDVRNFFRGKTVLVLGSAGCVAKLKANFMETFDVIVRSNNYKPFNPCHRVDVYYSFLGGSVKKSMNEIVKDGAKFVFCRCPDSDFSKHVGGKYIPGKSFDARPVYQQRKDWFKIPYFIQTKNNYQKNYELLDRLLTTGVSSIVDVLRYEPARLFVAGFDFFTTLIHNTDEPCNLNTGHDFPGEYNLVKKLWQDGKIEISEEMKKLFEKGNPEWDYRRLLKNSQ
jgi:hypothetical protein